MCSSGRYCPTCKNDTSEVVKAGEKLKASKKKAKMPSAHTESQRDWGKVRHTHTDIHTQISTHIHTHTHRYPHTHTHTHTSDVDWLPLGLTMH